MTSKGLILVLRFHKHHSMAMPPTKRKPVAIVAMTIPLNYNEAHV